MSKKKIIQPIKPDAQFPNFRANFYAWSQKVLPTVYDDSLSYLERIDKMQWFLNQVIDDNNLMKKLIQEFADYYNVAIDQLYEWFNNLDVYEEIYQILYEMVDNGTLERILNNLFFNFKSITSGHITNSAPWKSDNDIVPYIMKPSVTGTKDQNEINILYQSIDAHHIYEWYDKLVEDNHQSRHSYIWDYMSDGTPLKWYRFEATSRYDIPVDTDTNQPRYDEYYQQNMTKPTLIITSGVHGNEKTNIWALYLTMRDILNGNNHQDEYIRRNYDIILMPAVNPYGLQHNTRENENKVDLNRNYDYKWNEDTATDKGKSVFSEKETQFVKAVRDTIITNNYVKMGTLFIDSHDFNFKNYANDRILWSATNWRPLRPVLMKIGGFVKDTLTKMYPKLITNPETQKFFSLGATGTGYGSTCNAWNYKNKVKSFSMECPNYLECLGVGDQPYSYESSRIGYEIVRNFIVNSMFESAGEVPRDIIPGFHWALTNEDDSFIKTLRDIPQGRQFVVPVYDRDSTFSKSMPLDPVNNHNYYGMFIGHKSPTINSVTGSTEFFTTSYEGNRHFVGGFESQGFTGWTEMQKRFYNNVVDSSFSIDYTKATLLELIQLIPQNSMWNARIYSAYPNLLADCGGFSGILKITKGSGVENYCELQYTRGHATSPTFYTAYYSVTNGLSQWVEQLKKTPLNVDLTSATLIDLINGIQQGDTWTGRIYSNYPNLLVECGGLPGILKIVKNASSGNYCELQFTKAHALSPTLFIAYYSDTNGLSPWVEQLKRVIPENNLDLTSATLIELITAIPQNSSWSSRIYSTYVNLLNDCGTYPGILKITKGSGSENYSELQFTRANSTTPTIFISYYSASAGLSPWIELQKKTIYNNFSELGLNQESSTIIDVFNALPVGTQANLYILTNSNGVWGELPYTVPNGSGYLSVVRSSQSLGYVEFTRYSNIGGNHRKVVSSFSSGVIAGWYDIPMTLIT